MQVINETVRLANIVPGIFRKTLTDIQFKGTCLLTINTCVSYCSAQRIFLWQFELLDKLAWQDIPFQQVGQ